MKIRSVFPGICALRTQESVLILYGGWVSHLQFVSTCTECGSDSVIDRTGYTLTADGLGLIYIYWP
jgi:hypothetical protein